MSLFQINFLVFTEKSDKLTPHKFILKLKWQTLVIKNQVVKVLPGDPQEGQEGVRVVRGTSACEGYKRVQGVWGDAGGARGVRRCKGCEGCEGSLN